MPVTINVNNLTLCHKGSNGISTATIPDVCKTPSPGGPVPVPYPNIAMSMDLMKGTTTVKSDGGMMCANYGSEFFKSTGDEPGVAGGVVSSTFIKEATWITFSFDVKLQGKAACRLTDKMFHNHQNTVNTAGEIQKPIILVSIEKKHECTDWVAKWIEGPLDVFEELEITPPLGPESINGQLLECWFVHFKVRFRGTVECVCSECGKSKTESFQSPSYEGSYKICYQWQPSPSDFIAAPFRGAQLAMKVIKGLLMAKKAIDGAQKAVAIAKILKEHGDGLLSAITSGVAAGKAILQGSASAICSGTFDVSKLQETLDSIPKQGGGNGGPWA
jgi:hypothetical protein